MLKFNLRIDEAFIRQKLKKEADHLLPEVIDTIVELLAQRTPKDTGKASESWTVLKRADGKYTLMNSSEYIKYLNAGSSTQAPANFIESVVLQFGTAYGSVVTYK